MKRLIFLILLLVATAPAAHAEISIRVCMADGNTPLGLADPCIPFVYRPIMVGTYLTIIISSDTGDVWNNGGELTIWDANQNYGILSGGSSLPAAGDMALLSLWQGDEEANGEEHDANGFTLGGGYNPSPGDWFIIDYNAISVGACSVLFYNWDIENWGDYDNPSCQMFFTHVVTRDFNGDGIVNFEDFAVLGSNWRRTDCSEPDNCSGTDLDADGYVGISDLMQFAEYWLGKTR